MIRFIFKPCNFTSNIFQYFLNTNGLVYAPNDFKTPFGNNKVENQNLILAFFLTDGNIAIFVVKRVLWKYSGVIFGLVYNRQSLKC